MRTIVTLALITALTGCAAIAQNRTAKDYSHTTSAPTLETPLSTPTVSECSPLEPAPVPPPLTEDQYRQIRLQKLIDQNLPYDEYKKRYKEIAAQ